MNEKEALKVIEEMITVTRQEIKDNGFYYFFWGWLVFVAAITNVVILKYELLEFHSISWVVLMPLGGIVTAIKGRFDQKKESAVKTYVSQSMQACVIAFSISLFVVCFAMPIGAQWKAFYPTIMMVYAIWLFISGKLLQFKPLLFGGYLNWLLALIGFIFPNTLLHLSLIALGVLGGFIIPGHLLNRRSVSNV
ncbi:MAG: hypothetical protein ACK5UI_03250 [Bacteroidota bacterium]|jgi:hypothetical protein